MQHRALVLLLAALTAGCASAAGSGDEALVFGGGGGGGFAVSGCDPEATPTRFISCVLSYEPGPGAGFGQAKVPEIIYGPPIGGGTANGSQDVLTLGGGGEIAFGFGGNAIVDGPGADFIVFENPFDIAGDPTDPYAEPGVVSVSEDGVTWVDFPCEKDTYPYTGCAGWHPAPPTRWKTTIRGRGNTRRRSPPHPTGSPARRPRTARRCRWSASSARSIGRGCRISSRPCSRCGRRPTRTGN